MDGDRFFLLGHLVAKREDGKAMTLSPLQRARDMAHFRISASDTVLYMNFESAATCWPCHFGLGCIIAYCFSSYIIVKYPASRLGLLPCQIPILLQIVSLFSFIGSRFPGETQRCQNGYFSFWPIRAFVLLVTKDKERSVNYTDSERRGGILVSRRFREWIYSAFADHCAHALCRYKRAPHSIVYPRL